MPQTGDAQWPDDPLERLEAKLDAYREEHRLALYGGPGVVGVEPRLKSVEGDLGAIKRAGGVVAAGGLAVAWDYLKRKLSL